MDIEANLLGKSRIDGYMLEGDNMNLLVVHDFDSALFTRKTSLKRAFWLAGYSIFKNSVWFRQKMPKWLMEEKAMQCLALAHLDKMLGVSSLFGLTSEVLNAFPWLAQRLQQLGLPVVHHRHSREFISYVKAQGKGLWLPDGLVNTQKHYGNYDREYVKGNADLPIDDSSVVWHVDHMSYNLLAYLDFLKRLGVHPISNIHPSARIGKTTKIHLPVYVGRNAIIGEHCRVGKWCHIGNEVCIGNYTVLEGQVYLADKTVIGDHVTFAPHACVGNDKYPPSNKWQPVIIHDHVVIGMNATINPDLIIAEAATVGAGAVVTKSVPPCALAVGNPAKVTL